MRDLWKGGRQVKEAIHCRKQPVSAATADMCKAGMASWLFLSSTSVPGNLSNRPRTSTSLNNCSQNFHCPFSILVHSFGAPVTFLRFKLASTAFSDMLNADSSSFCISAAHPVPRRVRHHERFKFYAVPREGGLAQKKCAASSELSRRSPTNSAGAQCP